MTLTLEETKALFRGAVPPFDLVPLTTYPPDSWRGRVVFMPPEQSSEGIFWSDNPNDEDYDTSKEDWEHVRYRVGVITRYTLSDYGPQEYDVFYLMSDGYITNDTAMFLWVIKETE